MSDTSPPDDTGSKSNGVTNVARDMSDLSLSPRRTKLPVPQPAKGNVNLWSYLKQFFGKELSKITMPVQWNEPISLLQRISEYMHYAELLRTASKAEKAEDRMAWVATFAVSALASNFERMGKPFNPLLGETYELQRRDFRLICEQVGHHPPVSAFYADSGEVAGEREFVFRGSMHPQTKFWGKSIEFRPKGVCTIELPKHDAESYTWNNVNCLVHIGGSLWMEQQGTMNIVNRRLGLRAVLNFKSGGWFSGTDDLHFLEGFIVDKDGKKLRFIYGRWTTFLCSADVADVEDFLKVSNMDKIDPSGSNLPKHAPLTKEAIPNSKVLWEVSEKAGDCDRYYNFSDFTMGLNEIRPEVEAAVAKTDSRKRPDIRHLENGELEEAAKEKERLENKQREYRKPFKKQPESEWWTPKWFAPDKNPHTNEDDWIFLGGYFERNFKDVPDIF